MSRSDAGKKRGKYRSIIPVSFRSLLHAMRVKKIKVLIDFDEFTFIMGQDCGCCGGKDPVTILPVSGDLTIHSAVPICATCKTLAMKMGVQKYVLHSQKVFKYASGYVQTQRDIQSGIRNN